MTPDLSAVLDAERAARGLSVRGLAVASGVPLHGVQKLLDGRTRHPRLDTLLALLGALGRDLAWLHDRGITPGRGVGRAVSQPNERKHCR